MDDDIVEVQGPAQGWAGVLNREYLTESIIESWQDEGSENLKARFALAVDDLDTGGMIGMFYECLIAVLNGTITVELIGPVLNAIIEDNEKEFSDLRQTFLHTLSFVVGGSDVERNNDGYYKEVVRLVLSLQIEKSLMLLVLEPDVLNLLGIAPHMFERRIVRANTNLLYKQKRFNLMREESEGYAKLLVEVYSASRSCDGENDDDEFLSKVRVTTRTIESIIGYFDLDPIRALDIILDVATTNLTDRCYFFISLLKLSPWWPKEASTGHEQLSDIGKGGNNMAAQLLGFKLAIYKSTREEHAKGVSVAVPENLMMLIALLIKEGFVSFGDIYNFLDPKDDELEKYEDKWKREIEDKAFLAKASALALAAPLNDLDSGSKGASTNGGGNVNSNSSTSANSNNNQTDSFLDAPSDRKSTNDTDKSKFLPIEHCPKALLLKCLLSVGSVNPSLYLLTKFSFLTGPYPEIATLINRLVEYSIDPLYQSIRNFPQTSAKSMTPKQLPCSSIKDTELAPQVSSKTIYVLNPPIDSNTTTRFFYKDWGSELELIKTQAELVTISRKFLNYSGPLLANSISLIIKICRIGCFFCKADPIPNGKTHDFWLEYFRIFLLPSLSLIEANPGAIHEIYNLMRYFSFEERYALYGEWVAVLAKSSPLLKLATTKAEKATKDVLKRLSKTNVKEMMRKLAKISYSNPIPSFTVFISQVESYDNLGELVIDAARYFTDIGWDALPFVVMMQLTTGRGTQQVDGLNDRKWIQCE